MMYKKQHKLLDLLLYFFSYSTVTIAITASLLMMTLPSNVASAGVLENNQTLILEQDKKIAGKLYSTLHFEKINLNVPSALRVVNGVVLINSDKLDSETIQKIKSISSQIKEVVSVQTESTI